MTSLDQVIMAHLADADIETVKLKDELINVP